ncbi:MAG: hypothetical protein GY795_31210 [Desulfobacterales bacterium]|nr:hypothetical protein [Desulfobacterales bacterium]
MAYFFSLRGWLEVEPDKFDCVTEVIKSLKKKYSKDTKFGLYIQGWTWSESAVNWTRYLFYGADVTYEGLEFFQDILIITLFRQDQICQAIFTPREKTGTETILL